MDKINFLHPGAKDLKKIHIWLRVIIQLIFFILIPSAYTAAFNGVKYIFSQIGAGEQIELTSFVSVLIMLCVFTMIFGRFFCGFACAFGSLGAGSVCLDMQKGQEKASVIGSKYWKETGCSEICFVGIYCFCLLWRCFF